MALREYCRGGGEAGLFRAYELGRQAARDGLGVLEMAAAHHDALVATLLDVHTVSESTRIAQRASEMFAECLAPFEFTRRVYREEHARLCAQKQGLEERLNAALHN